MSPTGKYGQAKICLHFLRREVDIRRRFVNKVLNTPMQHAFYEGSRKQGGTAMNWTYQFLVYADVNFLRENINAIMKNTEHILIAVK